MNGRESIVSALATVTGLTPGLSSPSSPVAGAAWPKWVQSRPAGKLHFVMSSEYDVCIVLPAGMQETSVEAADGLMAQCAAALLKIGTIEYCQPVMFTFDEGTAMPGIQFRMTTIVC